ncbi:SgcJ/EcaC family oxidoreductase [Hymenobacter negativus]|uniref:SgcJ/EcaC family oxidoreductase n=1 Tax=Hymenobacter negativus TaxID=2795026 RepID=A0ABS3QLG3_9BACT|nr:SgcJ/EcaC family oxidoreductase [Hymenobacter negativus]MBO2011853.1 SgcJ/EcaC family oxidoreductase [Hymenobacter negativus]
MNESALAAREQIQLLFDQLAAVWQAGDGEQFATNFTDDADYVVFDGTHLTGRAAIAQAHQELFSGVLRGSRLVRGAVTDFRLLAPTVALMHSTGAVQMRWQKQAPAGRESIQTMVAVLEGGCWQFAAFQNTRIKPPGLLAKLLLRLMK